jgi:tetratricopeptide (TPR) repeat protein
VTVLCQWCGAVNPEDRETCVRCKSNLLVFSGNGEPFEDEGEDSFEREKIALDEHLLERLSDSEETVKRLRDALIGLEDRASDLEQSVALLESGLKALVDLLDRRKVVREAEVMAAWERSASSEMAREELLDRLQGRREVVVSRARTAGEGAARTTERAMRSAELALLAGQPLRALDTLADALRRAPRNPELACLLGELVFEREDLGRAEAYFREAVRLDPAAVEPRIFLGAILADTGRREQACRELEHASRLAPESFLPHFALGSLHASAGNHTAARRHLRAALDRDRFPQAQVLLGLVELDAGRAGAACKVLEEAVATAPDYEDAIYSLGLAYLERGWRRKALECFHRVLELDPQRLQFQETVRLLEGIGEGPAPLPVEAGLLLREASQAAETGEVDRALKQLSRALQITEHPNILASLALLAAVAGRHRQALAVAHRLLRSEARGAAELAAWTAVLETLRATRRFRFADRCGRRLFTEGEGDLQRALAAYELSLVELERGGDASHALELAHRALELIPRELRQHPLTALGRIHLKREEYSDAVDYLEQAAALAASPTVLTQLGLALLGRGDGERAREVLQQARSGAGRDLKTDVLTHVTRAGFLAAHGRRRG